MGIVVKCDVSTKEGKHSEWTTYCCPKCTKDILHLIDIMKAPN